VTCAHAAEMTLQGPRAELACARCTIYRGVTVSQRRDDGRSDCLGRRQADSSHLQV
jgi:hypothetical protein